MLWQKLMIRLATNQQVKQWMQNSRKLSALAGTFVGGSSEKEAVTRVEQLLDQGKRASLFYLGEYVQDTKEIVNTMSDLEGVGTLLAQQQFDIHISVDPTQIGLMNSSAQFETHARQLAHQIKELSPTTSAPTSLLMIDMEDASVTQQTLNVYHRLIEEDLPCGVTLQAYLHRTASDLERIIDKGGTVRLVKGAFAEPATIAHTRRQDIDSSYFTLAQKMLSKSAKDSGFYPIFGTHDPDMIERIIQYAAANGWQPQEYEFECLLGVRESLQDTLVAQGQRVRVYVPFGTEWWPYSVRRVGENPKNMRFVMQSILQN